MKNFFKIEKAYEFEWNDLRACITIINVILIMMFGLSIAWFGLMIAVFGLGKDLTGTRHINEIVMHIMTIVLNVYFINIYLTTI